MVVRVLDLVHQLCLLLPRKYLEVVYETLLVLTLRVVGIVEEDLVGVEEPAEDELVGGTAVLLDNEDSVCQVPFVSRIAARQLLLRRARQTQELSVQPPHFFPDSVLLFEVRLALRLVKQLPALIQALDQLLDPSYFLFHCQR